MSILGGAMLPHAPQFFTEPPTEDMANVAQVREVARRIGEGLHALKPDLWIIIANDHAQQFFHQCAPAFTVHVGGEAGGQFAGRTFHWPVPSEIGFALVRDLYRSGFDPAFTSTAEIDYALRHFIIDAGNNDGDRAPFLLRAQPHIEFFPVHHRHNNIKDNRRKI